MKKIAWDGLLDKRGLPVSWQETGKGLEMVDCETEKHVEGVDPGEIKRGRM